MLTEFLLPERVLKKHGIIRLLELLPLLKRAISFFGFAQNAHALAIFQLASGDLIPDFEEETGIQRLVLDRNSVVTAMVVGSVHDRIVRIDEPGHLMPGMQINAIHVEKSDVGHEHGVQISIHDQREDQQRRRARKLI